jgi:hypothetical protein
MELDPSNAVYTLISVEELFVLSKYFFALLASAFGKLSAIIPCFNWQQQKCATRAAWNCRFYK